MLKSRDKIELAIMAGLVAESVLQLMSVGSLASAKIIRSETAEKFLELDRRIKALVED